MHLRSHVTIWSWVAYTIACYYVFRHWLNGYLAQRVPSLFLASSFMNCLNCAVLKCMFAWRTRPIKPVPSIVSRLSHLYAIMNTILLLYHICHITCLYHFKCRFRPCSDPVGQRWFCRFADSQVRGFAGSRVWGLAGLGICKTLFEHGLNTNI